MLIAISVGNTQTVIGVFEGDRKAVPLKDRAPGELPGLKFSWRVATNVERTADEYALLLQELFSLKGFTLLGRAARAKDGSSLSSLGELDGVALSSSVPSIAGGVREMVTRWLGVPIVVVEPGIKTGMPILYDNPKEVGADRVVNAVAALDLFGAPAIVVDLGTATTFDAISASGEYVGGSIVTGIEISMDALFARTAALPRVALTAPRHAIGRSTVESMQSGAIFGHAAVVDGLCRRIEAELGPSIVIGTGGLVSLIAPHAEKIAHVEPFLTLHGLRIVYERNIEDLRVGRGK